MKHRSLLKRLVSRLCGLYPNTFFYGSESRVNLNGFLEFEKSTTDGQKMSPLSQAALMMSIAVSERMNVGDELTAKFYGTTHSGEDRGSFEVQVRRTA